MSALKPIEWKGNFINGEFVKPAKAHESISNQSPANLEELVFQGDTDVSHVKQACEAAQKAFKTWSLKSIQERMEILNRVKEIFVSKEDEFAETISRETGKPLWETKTEAKAIV